MSTPLKQVILQDLGRIGKMTFDRYMALCLYHPEHGYYTQGRERTGREGDYFTSSDLHPVFARLVARQAAEMWNALDRPEVFTWVEMGAGRGLFAADFLNWSAAMLPEFFRALRYIAIEPGSQQRRRISDRIATSKLKAKLSVIASLDELEPISGCFFSNELVDAFPVNVVSRVDGRLKEIYVVADGENLTEKAGPISDSAIAAYTAKYAHQLENGHRIEVNRNAQVWIKSVASKLHRGFVLTFDYGDLSQRLFIDRPRGTLLAYHGHQADEDFYRRPGETDLTAHVNFSALIDAGSAEGLEFSSLTTQERFLMALGGSNEFADLYDEGETEVQKLNARLKLKRLIAPDGMGGTFKVLLQKRGAPGEGLTGWKFERKP